MIWVMWLGSLAASATANLTVVPPTKLSACVASNATATDKATMARWLFIAEAQHPDLQDLAHVSPEQKVEIDKRMAAVFDRLVFETCRAEAVSTLKDGGLAAFKTAFIPLGQAGASVITSSPAVQSQMRAMSPYADRARFNALERDAGIAESYPNAGNPK
jgi:hypothetical protein